MVENLKNPPVSEIKQTSEHPIWEKDKDVEDVGNIVYYKKGNRKLIFDFDKIIYYKVDPDPSKQIYHEKKKVQKIPMGDIKIIKEIFNKPVPSSEEEVKKDFPWLKV